MLLLFLITFSGFVSTQVSAFVSSSRGDCTKVFSLNGSIEDSYGGSYNSYSKCWRISVPENHFIRLKIQSLSFNNEDCRNTYLEINTDEEYKFCRRQDLFRTITALSDVQIHFNAYFSSRFKLNYEIKDVECSRSDSFHCTPYSCIPKSRVCDEVMDCLNGADEIGCATGINSVEGIAEARKKAIVWLRNRKSPLKGWRENTVRAITALYLAEKSTFNSRELQEELMAKQIELETAVSLLKGTVSNQLLSMHINALLLTCQDPRHFYGRDLVKLLKDQVKESGNFTHPSAYLALCNAKEEWPHRSTSDIVSILSSDSEYSFIGDFQAFAVMAVACYNETKFLNTTASADLLSVYQKTIKDFKEHQLPDGSFGNVHATSLITQSLLASGQEHTKDWKLNETLKYLMKELENSNADFLAYYLTLPILNGKTLTDIRSYNCSLTTVDPREQLELEMKHHTGSKIQIQYSLFVGDEKDIIHTIHLKVPSTFTAFQVLQSAEAEDPKYKFQWKKVFDKIDVYKVAQISNDPEIGKFWLLFHGTGKTDVLNHSFPRSRSTQTRGW
nr:uncharacterized protein CG3556 isoform X1 [Parasteatoda tepidariorum]XP_042910965.1 uncharacterized protein CG3556 isoform X2 [Parasteatoda tepidariorum]